MKSFIQFIRESILESTIQESGNAIKNVSKIPPRDAVNIYNEIESLILSKIPNAKMCPLGSLGKKRDDQTHGDIDIAYLSSDVKEVNDMIQKVFAPLMPDQVTEINPRTTASTASIGWLFDGGIAQIDFMSVTDLDWARFRYDSPDFRNFESDFKGGVRCVLLRCIIGAIPVENNTIEYFEDGVTVKSKYKYTMNDNGLFKQFISYAGKNGPLKNPKKDKSLEQFITYNPKEIMEFVFGGNARPEDFKTAESLWKAFHDKSKFPYDDKVVKEIEDRFYKEELEPSGLTIADFEKIVKKHS